MGARVLDVELPVGKADRRLAEADDELRESLAGVVEALAEEVCGSSAEPAVPPSPRLGERVAAPPTRACRVCETRAMRATMLLADFAQVSDGKLTDRRRRLVVDRAGAGASSASRSSSASRGTRRTSGT